MITTDFVPGTPCWLDLGAPDVDAAAAFYGAVFGWEFQSFGQEAGGYGAFRLDRKTVGALGPLTEEGARPAWMLYFHTEDVDTTVKTVEQLGGTVRVPPLDAGDDARMAQFTDPQGGQFAVWQPGTSPGLETVDQPGSMSWIELYTTDVEAAKEFYGNLFGWQIEPTELPGGGGTYWIVTPADLAQERMFGGLMELSEADLAPMGGRPYWHPVFDVADCDATVAKITENGGTVQMGPDDAPGVGRLAVCVDPSGADFVVLSPTEM